jgi:protein-disulfide isomerase
MKGSTSPRLDKRIPPLQHDARKSGHFIPARPEKVNAACDGALLALRPRITYCGSEPHLRPESPMKLFPLAAAALIGLSAPAFAIDLEAMTDTEKAAFGAAVRTYLLENPEVLSEAIEVLNTRQADEAAMQDVSLVKANEADLFSDTASFVGGNPEGDITVVEFIDYRCGYCKKAHSEVNDLVEMDGNIRYIVKEFPILSEESVVAARFAIATLQVAGPEAYAKVNAGFYESFRGDVTPETLSAFAKELGLDPAPILARMEAPEVTKVIADNHALAQRMQISGTPTFVMGGQMVRGYVPLQAMQATVAAERG